ncbi:hypothetical protein K490DRAFT_60336 [Saccharata proteae CBS 121410]|uniref:Rab proteins geranylgeranyltransferase n=1 Tax=Saccharata proteae CBS 121410 TaxID=1314787 RepID=A0A9P4HL39_9PEZI|nr:hypothetical protein K490DRAFT_60336 [Saccharata proteae CBS 121410]
MDTLQGTEWDVLIAGTGIEQSLLALALSRSGKKVLHVDKNEYYGGREAAFSLQEAENWADGIGEDDAAYPIFRKAVFRRSAADDATGSSKLSFPRAYSLSLAPQLIHTRSALLPLLVSSKVYRQLEFLAVGSWWVYSSSTETSGILHKVPGGREDVFADQSTDFKAKRMLMKFLRFVGDFENQRDVWQDYASKPFPDFLSDCFKIPTELHAPLLALTLSLNAPRDTSTEYALSRIATHLRSIGVFGPGFGCVIPKWGGLAEISQVACRAGAVGGGIYVLGQGISKIESSSSSLEDSDADSTTPTAGTTVHLKDGDKVTTTWIVASEENVPVQTEAPEAEPATCSRTIAIVSSALGSLFPPLAEVYVFVHSSDTGVLYATTLASSNRGYPLLDSAIAALLSSVADQPRPALLWKLQYERLPRASASNSGHDGSSGSHANIHLFPPSGVSLAFNDEVLDHVRIAWQKIMGPDADPSGFMVFEEREGLGGQMDEE